MDVIRLAVNTVGSAGAAGGSAATPIPLQGKVYAVYLDYSSAAPSTTDVILQMQNAPNEAIVSRANASADAWLYPRRQVHDNAGAGLVYTGTAATGGGQVVAEPYVVHDHLLLSVAQADALTPAVTATIYLTK